MRPEVPRANRIGVMGIPAVQAGALTSAIDRPLPGDHPEMEDFARAAGFRRLARELEVSPAVLAHRYGPSLDIDTLVLGVTNRRELAECVEAAEAGRLPASWSPASIGVSIGRGEIATSFKFGNRPAIR